ncbi:hypothetical protein [Ralstonia phage RP31]|uniref:AB hydrolase-1 domain-containing protein n=2 Tax=Ripduovirus RP12 TaxID=2560700 RepID=A0A1L7N183_9CAUD|nr:esterase/lipase [Ralstonia phage RP12]BAW19243.1 hypothetical protein [Ralstonia phage RP12]BAW19529.1 hypothetical protein [Ralstonia phage RP31]
MDTIKNGIQIRTEVVGNQTLRVGIRAGNPAKAPLLLFNGIGANIEILAHFVDLFDDIEVIIFDIPGTGESPTPLVPYHLAAMAVLANNLLDHLGYAQQVDVMGISWGGALAQEFAYLYPERCRKLVLAATTPGIGMVPGSISVISKMLNPKRYTNPEYMTEIGGELYGGDFRDNPELIKEHASHLKRPELRGYVYQLMAIMNWSSLRWLGTLKQKTLIMHGSDDPIVPLANAEIMASRIPDSTLHVVDDGHLFLVSRAAESTATIREFLHG